MNHVEGIKLIVKLDLKLQCEDYVYVIKVMHMYLLKKLRTEEQLQHQIMLMKN